MNLWTTGKSGTEWKSLVNVVPRMQGWEESKQAPPKHTDPDAYRIYDVEKIKEQEENCNEGTLYTGDFPTLSLNKPTLLYLSDNPAIGSNSKGMAGFRRAAGLIEEHLGGKEIYGQSGKEAEFYTLTYSRNKVDNFTEIESNSMPTIPKWQGKHLKNRLAQVQTHKEHPEEYFSMDAAMAVDKILLPSLQDAEGALLPVDEIKAKLQNLTLVGYSYGSIFSHELANALHNRLAKEGMDKADIKEVLKEVVVICAPNVSRVASKENLFTGIYFEGQSDACRHYVQDLEDRGEDNYLFDGLLRAQATGDRVTKIETRNGVPVEDGLNIQPSPSAAGKATHALKALPLTKTMVEKPLPEQEHIELSEVSNGVIARVVVPEGMNAYYSHPRVEATKPKHQGEYLQIEDKANHTIDLFILPQKGAYYSDSTEPGLNHRHRDALFGRALRNAFTRSERAQKGETLQRPTDYLTQPSYISGQVDLEASGIDAWFDERAQSVLEAPKNQVSKVTQVEAPPRQKTPENPTKPRQNMAPSGGFKENLHVLTTQPARTEAQQR